MTMATDTRSHLVGNVMARAGLAVYSARLALGILTWAIVSGVCWLGLFWIDNLLRLPGGLRFPLALCGVIATVASFWSCVVQRIRNRKTPGQIAVLLEQNYGIDDNVLINSFEFEQGEFSERQRPFIEATLGAGQVGLKDVDAARSLATARHSRNGAWAWPCCSPAGQLTRLSRRAMPAMPCSAICFRCRTCHRSVRSNFR